MRISANAVATPDAVTNHRAAGTAFHSASHAAAITRIQQVYSGTAIISASQVNGNTAPGAFGGGILNHGAMTINLSQVDNNATPADSPGGQGGGGGIANLNITPLTGAPDSGVLTVNLSQVRNNSAGGLGGGILEDGVNPGDSLGPAGGPLTLKLSQVTGNTAAEGGGIYASSGSPVALKVTLVARNVPDNCFPLGSIPGCTN